MDRALGGLRCGDQRESPAKEGAADRDRHEEKALTAEEGGQRLGGRC